MLDDFLTQAQVEEYLERNPSVLILPDDIMPDLREVLAGMRYGLTVEGLRALKAAELTA